MDLGTFDYIVVGAGSAGCVLANRLSADPSTRGAAARGRRQRQLSLDPHPGRLSLLHEQPAHRLVLQDGGRAGAERARAQLSARQGAGRLLVDQRHDLHARPGARLRPLAPAGPHRLGLGRRAALLQAHEDYAGADDLHGAGGEWRIEQPRISWKILDAFRDAAAEIGIPKVEDFNRGDNEGCGYFHVNQRRGIRWTASKAFLRPVKSRANLRVVTGAQARHVILDGRRATGLALWLGGAEASATARREVILAAGAIGSPHLLQLSGIGPAETLQAHGVAVRHALPGVGANLQDHLQLRCIYKVSNAVTLNQTAARLVSRIGMGMQYALFRRGPMTMAPSTLGAFAKSDTAVATANLEYHVQPLSLDRFGEPLHSFPAITASVCNLRPTSRGSVTLRSADAREPPAIRPNYLATPEDRRVAADAIRLTRRIMAARAMSPYAPREHLPGDGIDGDDGLAQAAGQIGTTIFHPVATCRMGVDGDAGAVVDGELRVRGVERLRVIDASVMPKITSGNTAAPTMMIAEKGAAMVLAAAKA
jgi:choline dehydrogenase